MKAKANKSKAKTIKLRPDGTSGVKRGRISRAEDKAIANALAQNKTVEEISLSLKRPETQVAKHIRKFYGKGDDVPAKASEVAEFTRQLRNSIHWKTLQEHYRKEDLVYYEELYAQIMTDFKDDVTFVDEMQILQALDSHMLINEHKRHRKAIEAQIYDIDRQVSILQSELMNNPADDALKIRISTLESQKQALVGMSSARVRAFTDLSNKFDKTIAELKGARNQRLKSAENSNKSFTELIKHVQHRQTREKEGKYAALVKFATDKATKKLQEPHRYINDEIDQPILTPENIQINLPDEAFTVEEMDNTNARTEETKTD